MMPEPTTESPWFRVKFADGREIEIHSPEAITIYKERFEKLILQHSHELTNGTHEPASEKQTHGEGPVEFPTIKTSKSTTENLKALFATDWAKGGPTVTELTEALNVNAVPDKPNNISTYLTRLVKANVIRRLEKEGIYHFYPLPKAS